MDRCLFYVTARDGARTHLLAGPYPTKAEAHVDRARRIALDPARNASAARAAFAGYGVSRLRLNAGEAAPVASLGVLVE